MAWAEAYLCIKWHLDPSSRLATTDIGRKLGAVPLLGETRSPSNAIMSPGPRPISVPNSILIHQAIWPQRTWPKIGGYAPFGGAGSPSNTMWPGLRPTSASSFILIHPTVWPQYTNVTDKQTGQDRQWSDSIGRTILQTVAQKYSARMSL